MPLYSSSREYPTEDPGEGMMWISAEVWAETTARIPRPWPSSTMAIDYLLMAAANECCDVPVPSLSALAERWGASEEEARASIEMALEEIARIEGEDG